MSSTFKLQTPDNAPHLIAVVDTEEEFDWSKPYSRDSTTVEHMQHIDRLQSIYDRFLVKPVYVVDYPIASQQQAFGPLRRFCEEGRAKIGTHVHSWVSPPYQEELSVHNSYQGNLTRELEFEKVAVLTNKIEESFGSRPTTYKAGRYGVGPNTYPILSELGYRVDLSPAPPLDFSDEGGPDFSRTSCEPFQDQATGLLVIPGTGTFLGWLPGEQRAAYRWATTGWRSSLHANALFNRSGALKRLWLSPENFSGSEMVTLTRHLIKNGVRTFVISLHSPVVLAGATPFARDEQGVTTLLQNLSDYFEYFFGELQGRPWTPDQAFEHWLGSDKPQSVAASLPQVRSAGV